jgi:hypothetical protein
MPQPTITNTLHTLADRLDQLGEHDDAEKVTRLADLHDAGTIRTTDVLHGLDRLIAATEPAHQP